MLTEKFEAVFFWATALAAVCALAGLIAYDMPAKGAAFSAAAMGVWIGIEWSRETQDMTGKTLRVASAMGWCAVWAYAGALLT